MPPITNTLETSRRLEGMGFPPPQARGLAELFEETASSTAKDLKSYIDAKFDLVLSKIEDLRKELRSEIRLSEEKLRAEFHKGWHLQLFWYVTIQSIITGGYLTLAKYLFPSP